MKKTLGIFSLAAAAALMLSLPSAHAFEFSAVGGLNYAHFTQTSTAGTTSESSSAGAFTFGVLGSFSAVTGIQIETGVLKTERKFTVSSVDIDFSDFTIPILARFTALPIVSFGAGPYMRFGTGQVTETQAGIPYFLNFGDTGSLSSTELGIVLDARAGFSAAPSLSVILDVRYDFGLTNRAVNPNNDDKFTDLTILAGVTFAL